MVTRSWVSWSLRIRYCGEPSLTGSLLGDLSLNVQVGPLGLPIPGLGGLVCGIIGNAAGSIDQLLAQVLATLGIGIGQADVWVTGVRCDRAVLVN